MKTQQFAELEVVLAGGNDRKGGGTGPLVVLLHGFGAPGDDLVSLSRGLTVPEGVRFAFPAAPIDLAASALRDSGAAPPFADAPFGAPAASRAWWHIDMMAYQMAIMSGRLEASLASLSNGLEDAATCMERCLKALVTELQVPEGKVLLGGFSQGAMLSTHLVLNSAVPLAGALLMSGGLVAPKQWGPKMDRFHKLPVLQSHGRADAVVPFALGTQLKDQLEHHEAKLRWLPFSGGHEIPHQVLANIASLVGEVLGP